MILLFQDTTDLIDKGLTITPYSGTVYGAIVVLLCVAVVMLWRKLGKSEADYRALAKEVVEVLAKVSLRMEDTKNDGELLKAMNTTLNDIKQKLNA